jgi:hypothetical protein
MMARIWHGAVPVAKSDAYLKLMRSIAIPNYQKTPGNRGAFCLHRIEGDIAQFEMLTFWDDVAAIKRFAGEDYNVAYYYDFDADFLIEKEPYVRHFELYKD